MLFCPLVWLRHWALPREWTIEKTWIRTARNMHCQVLIMELLCDWNSFVAFHAGEVQATCAISSVVDLQNLLGTTLVLRVVFNLKTKPTPSSRLHSRRPKGQTRTLMLSLHRCRPRRQSCPTLLATSLQPCQRQDHLCLGCSDALVAQWWAIKKGKKGLAIEAALASRASSSLTICKIHWFADD